jgi:hypothetical protein
MICRDIAVVDVDPQHWVHLLRGPGGSVSAPGTTAERGWLLLVHAQGRIVHASCRGRRVGELCGQNLGDLRPLRQRYGVSRVLSLERGFMGRALARADGKLAYRMDYAQQMLILLDAFRKERGTGIHMEPPSPPGPLPPYAWLQAAFDGLWPDDSCLAFYVLDDERNSIWTSLILRKRSGDLDLLTTDLHLGDEGLDPTCWRGDLDRFEGVLTARVARPFMGVYVSLEAYGAWLDAPFGSQTFARLRAGHDLLLQPFPRRLRWPVGLSRFVAGVLRWMQSKN